MRDDAGRATAAVQEAEAEEPCSAAGLDARLTYMLLGDGERPRASDKGKAASSGSQQLVVALRDAAHTFFEANEEAVKAACKGSVRLIDEMDVLAYLTADVFGRPLLHHDDANALGKCVASQASRADPKIKAAEKAVSDAVRRATAAGKDAAAVC